MSEVISFEGELGAFRATVQKNPRYVSESTCTGCGDCVASCPYQVDDDFNEGLSKRKAIFVPFPQAVPGCALIDRESCQYFRTGKCRICERVCKSQAVNFRDRKRRLRLNVGAVIVATGFEPYGASGLEEYGLGEMEDVVTALQYERMLSASGPTEGEVRRPSDSTVPNEIAFIQCVGSRDERYKKYCSAVCCMHATKEAMLTAEHHPGARSYIFYTDMRSPGKGFQEYVNRARTEYGVEYIRSRPGTITRKDDTGRVSIVFDDMLSRKVNRLDVDMVVLCTALTPHRSNSSVAGILGMELDEEGFVRSPDPLGIPFGTTVPGVLAAGYCAAPQDIPDSLVQASAAAAYAAEMLARRVDLRKPKRRRRPR